MNSNLAKLLVFSFIALAVFGFMGMISPEPTEKYESGCIASMVNGGSCPATSAPLEKADFHLNAYSGFSQAINQFIDLEGLIAFFASLLFGSIVLSSILPELIQRFAWQTSYVLPSRKRLDSWLSLREKCDLDA